MKKIPLQDIFEPIQSEMLSVQEILFDQIQVSDPHLAPVFEQLSMRQGKRLRPALVLLSGKLIASINPEHLDLAATVELIHIASLLHDDVIDKSDLRRGRPSANALWGNTAAVLLGDFLLSRAFTLASQSRFKETLSVLGQASQTLCKGELKQNLLRGRDDLTEPEYFQIIEAKTAALFQCSCRLGAVCSDATEQQAAALGDFGFQFGLAFQIADDIKDVLSSEKQEGKTLGTDLREGKLTLPVIHWINQDPDQQPARISRLSELKDTAALADELRSTGSIEYAARCAQQHLERARQSLSDFPAVPSKETLLALTDHIADCLG